LFLPFPSWAESPLIDFSDTSTSATMIGAVEIRTGPEFTLSIATDGQLSLNGKSIDRMSDPEIKATMREIAKWLEAQGRDRSMVNYYDRQTGFLLEELGACQKKLKVEPSYLKDCLVERYRQYEVAWDEYLIPRGQKTAVVSRAYTETEKQEFIRTMAVMDTEGQKKCIGLK
jgi:hypothetical protein